MSRHLLEELEKSGATWERAHTTSESGLRKLRERAQRNSGQTTADLNAMYLLRLSKSSDMERVLIELNALEIIEYVEPRSLPVPPP